jgi:hypothetical protein
MNCLLKFGVEIENIWGGGELRWVKVSYLTGVESQEWRLKGKSWRGAEVAVR